MGLTRNGARTLLDLMARCCRLSRLPGFQLGLSTILGAETATSFNALWMPLCAFVDALVATDNYFNQRDTANDDGTGEDAAAGS